MHEEHFLSSWLLEDVEGQADMKEWEKEAEAEESKSGKREAEREEENTVIKRSRSNPTSSNFWANVVPWMSW